MTIASFICYFFQDKILYNDIRNGVNTLFNKDKDERAKEREKDFDLFQEEFLNNMKTHSNKMILDNIIRQLKSPFLFDSNRITTLDSTLLEYNGYININILNELLKIEKQNEELNNKFDKQIKQNEALTTEFKELNNKFDKLIELLSKE